MKMQKLCYLAHGYALVELNEALLDERFEAWKFGPVLPSLYHLLKGYRWGAIQEYIKDFDYDSRTYVNAPPPTEKDVSEVIEFVWAEYGDMAATDLSDWTHEKDGPWDTVVSGEEHFIRNLQIPDDLIRDYFFRALYSDAAPAQA